MKSPDEIRTAALALAAGRALSDAEIRERLAQASDPQYWLRLSPTLRVSERRDVEELALTDGALADVERHFSNERYFRTPPLIPPAVLSRMNAAIDAVRAAGWPSAFALVGDDFWSCRTLSAIQHLLAARLGAGVRQIPHVWIHVVRAVDGASGWMPHFDDLRKRRVSIWIALTEATTDNGCMFLVPPNLLPPSLYTFEARPVDVKDALTAMHATRALPAPAGAALGWDFDVLHWGGRAVDPGMERRALSMEFLAADESAHADEQPLLDATGRLPPLSVRLKVIGMGLWTYAKFEPALQRFRGLAEQLKALD